MSETLLPSNLLNEQTRVSQPGSDVPRFDTEKLFQGHSTVELIHAGQRYLLRLTRENKLILTK